MFQEQSTEAQRAEERTQDTRAFVPRVRTLTRRKYTLEEKIRIVLEGFRREVTVSDLCRREGIKPGAYYAWIKDFMEAGKERLTRDTVRNATRQEIEQLQRESHDLKLLVADLTLQVERLKKTTAFRDYLESRWHLSNFHASYFDLPTVLASYSREFDMVERAVQKFTGPRRTFPR
mgnify:CR=1 FL=1